MSIKRYLPGDPTAEDSQHGDGEACYFCATDAELMAALRGWPLTTFYMHAPQSFCPNEPAVEDVRHD